MRICLTVSALWIMRAAKGEHAVCVTCWMSVKSLSPVCGGRVMGGDYRNFC